MFPVESWFNVDARAPSIPLLNFPFKSPNWFIAEAPSNPLLNLPFKSLCSFLIPTIFATFRKCINYLFMWLSSADNDWWKRKQKWSTRRSTRKHLLDWLKIMECILHVVIYKSMNKRYSSTLTSIGISGFRLEGGGGTKLWDTYTHKKI